MHWQSWCTISLALVLAAPAVAVDPTFLKRNIHTAEVQPDELTDGGRGAAYHPLFGGKNDPHARMLRSVARYGMLAVQPGGRSAAIRYADEEQIYFILTGTGSVACDGRAREVKPNDFLYLPPGSLREVRNSGSEELRLLVMGFRIPQGAAPPPARQMLAANTAEVPLQTLPGHGPTTQFQLLMGTTESTRDKLAAASQMVSLFLMDFAPGGTNIPHHHPAEEEIYFVLRGSGEMVAGGGMDGIEGRHPTRQGDVWFLRLNTTVGFYSGAKEGQPHDQVLAVRSTYPFPPSRRP
jgi:mannose-6-phosphate isomerase-like protein (cupin superfamily)